MVTANLRTLRNKLTKYRDCSQNPTPGANRRRKLVTSPDFDS